MREIKFRVWDKILKRMLSWEWVHDNFFSRIFDYLNMIPMQYTGRKDKNRKDIYEADIVTGSSLKDWRAGNGEREIIEWDNTRSRWDMVFYSIYGGEGHLCKEEIFQDRAKFYEVIGNIYENGSLLDGK